MDWDKNIFLYVFNFIIFRKIFKNLMGFLINILINKFYWRMKGKKIIDLKVDKFNLMFI